MRIYEFIDELGEDRRDDINYRAETKNKKSDEVVKLVAEIRGQEAKGLTRACNKIIEITEQVNELTAKKNELSAQVKGTFPEYFDMEEDVMTLVLETTQTAVTLSKVKAPVKAQPNQKQLIEELTRMVFELGGKQEQIDAAYKKATTITQNTDKPSRSMSAPTSITEGMVGDFIKKIVNVFTRWKGSYESRLSKINKQAERLAAAG